MENIFNFILTEVENEEFTKDFYHSFKSLYLGNNGLTLLIHNKDTFKELIAATNPEFKFRVLVHAEIRDYKKESINKSKGFATLKELKRTYPNGKFMLISGEENIFPSGGTIQFEFLEVNGDKIYNKNDLTYKGFFTETGNDYINTHADFVKKPIAKGSDSPESVSEAAGRDSKINIPPLVTIITALTKDEYECFRSDMTKDVEQNGIFTGNFKPVEKFKNDYQRPINLVRQKKMGSVEAAITTNQLILKANPEIIIMSGVCGGRESETNLYDIIIPSHVIDIITGKYEKSMFIPYGYSETINEDLIEYLSETSRVDEIKDRMYSLIPNNKANSRRNQIVTDLNIKFDPMACGPMVLKTDHFLEQKAKEINNKIVAFEMESYGVMRAVNAMKETNKMGVIVKSVMDFTNENKEDVVNGEPVKSMAAYMSYLCVRVLIPYLDSFYTSQLKK